MSQTNAQDLYRRPYLTTSVYAVGLLLFLLPFFNIKCNHVTMAQISGISMVTGSKPRLSGDLEQMGNSFGGNDASVKSEPAGEGRVFTSALIALVLGVIGLLLSLAKKNGNQRPAMIVGALGAVALLASWIEVASYVSSNADLKNNPRGGSLFPESGGGGFAIKISTSPTFWFFLSILCFAAAAYISYQQSRTPAGETPSPAAPQLNINNPGDQSEFPKAPEEERDLG